MKSIATSWARVESIARRFGALIPSRRAGRIHTTSFFAAFAAATIFAASAGAETISLAGISAGTASAPIAEQGVSDAEHVASTRDGLWFAGCESDLAGGISEIASGTVAGAIFALDEAEITLFGIGLNSRVLFLGLTAEAPQVGQAAGITPSTWTTMPALAGVLFDELRLTTNARHDLDRQASTAADSSRLSDNIVLVAGTRRVARRTGSFYRKPGT